MARGSIGDAALQFCGQTHGRENEAPVIRTTRLKSDAGSALEPVALRFACAGCGPTPLPTPSADRRRATSRLSKPLRMLSGSVLGSIAAPCTSTRWAWPSWCTANACCIEMRRPIVSCALLTVALVMFSVHEVCWHSRSARSRVNFSSSARGTTSFTMPYCSAFCADSSPLSIHSFARRGPISHG